MPFENNLAMVDFIELQQAAAEFLEDHAAGWTVASAWPYTAALRSPEYGFVSNKFPVIETEDFHTGNVERKVNGSEARVLVVYSRTWEPKLSVLRSEWIRAFLQRYYEYEPQITPEEVETRLGMSPAFRWDKRGQWIQIYTK